MVSDEGAMKRAIVRISHEIIEKNENLNDLCLIGIKTRGVPLAKRIAKCISDFEGKSINVGVLDITLHRDDRGVSNKSDAFSGTVIPFDVNGKNIPTSKSEIIKVSISETDDKDSIEIFEKQEKA